jgi:hypothetical protein
MEPPLVVVAALNLLVSASLPSYCPAFLAGVPVVSPASSDGTSGLGFSSISNACSAISHRFLAHKGTLDHTFDGI